MSGLADRLGLDALRDGNIGAVALALGIVLLAGALAWLASRKLGPLLGRLSDQYAGARGAEIAGHAAALAGYATAAILLALAIRIHLWPDGAESVLGLALAAAVALLAYSFVRALQLPGWAGLLLGMFAFTAVFTDVIDGLEPITRVLDQVALTVAGRRISLLDIVQIAITLLILLAVVRFAGRVFNHSIRHARGLDATQQLLAQKLVGIGLLVVAFFVGIDIIGIDLTALAVFSGALGLAVGFGLQKTFGNLIAGIILLMDRSIKPGDVIVVGDSFGHVTKIGVRAVSVVTRDGKEHLIPNENLMTQEVENWSYSSRDVRVHIPVGVSYDADLPLAQRLMIEAAKVSARVLDDPAPTVWLRAFGESSVDHEILVWISDPEGGVGNVQSEVLNRLWLLFKEHGVALPYPQRDIHVKDWPAPPGSPA